MKTKKTIAKTLKIPVDLFAKLKKEADKDRRSLHGFLIIKLEDSVK